MDLKKLFDTEDRAVSPVIGVILMVAITVILAAVIGAFVLGLGDQASSSAPQANFEFDFNGDDEVIITHNGGQNVDNSTIDVNVGSTNIYESGTINDTNATVTGWDGTIRTADELTANTFDTGIATNGETVRIIWTNPNGDSSNILSESQWPN